MQKTKILNLKGNFYTIVSNKENNRDLFVFFDWLFDDNKFETCDSDAVRKYTEKVKQLFIGYKIKYDYLNKMSFNNKTTGKTLAFQKTNGSFSKELIRHIRNGFAHNKVWLISRNRNLYIKIIDVNSYKNNQTAFIYSEYNKIIELYKIYILNNIERRKI